MNSAKLKSCMILKGKNVDSIILDLREFCGIQMDRSTFYRKMSGASEFDRNEILGIAKVLSMNKQDILNIFFETKVS